MNNSLTGTYIKCQIVTAYLAVCSDCLWQYILCCWVNRLHMNKINNGEIIHCVAKNRIYFNMCTYVCLSVSSQSVFCSSLYLKDIFCLLFITFGIFRRIDYPAYGTGEALRVSIPPRINRPLVFSINWPLVSPINRPLVSPINQPLVPPNQPTTGPSQYLFRQP